MQLYFRIHSYRVMFKELVYVKTSWFTRIEGGPRVGIIVDADVGAKSNSVDAGFEDKSLRKIKRHDHGCR